MLPTVVERNTAQVFAQSFDVKTLTFSMATRMYPIETKHAKTQLGTQAAHFGLVVLSVIVYIILWACLKHEMAEWHLTIWDTVQLLRANHIQVSDIQSNCSAIQANRRGIWANQSAVYANWSNIPSFHHFTFQTHPYILFFSYSSNIKHGV